jgi:hypothetical protein
VVCSALLAIMGLAVCGIDRSQTVKWIGATNLQVEFSVIDADSGNPIPAARIEISSDGGFYDGGGEEDRTRPFELRTDLKGMAHRVCRNNRCIGTQSGLCFTNTYVVYVPQWHVRVSAEGYDASLPLNVYEEYRGKVRHAGPQDDRLPIQIKLMKAARP